MSSRCVSHRFRHVGATYRILIRCQNAIYIFNTLATKQHYSRTCAYTQQSIRNALRSIAFKPAESGWGGGNKYTQRFDEIFGKKEKNDKKMKEKNSEGGNANENEGS